MKNSVIRYDLINKHLGDINSVSYDDLKSLLTTMYPAGLCCHYYEEFFGTLRAMVFDVNEGTVQVCFGSPALNDWYTFRINNESKYSEYTVKIKKDKAPRDFYELI